jgi:hypothetical protein
MSDKNSLLSRFMAFYTSLGVSEREFAKTVGVSQGFIQSVKTGSAFSTENLQKILSAYPTLSVDWLLWGTGEMLLNGKKRRLGDSAVQVVNDPSPGYGPHIVTVDSKGHESIVLVPYKAQAGYVRGYTDPEFIERLPVFSLPKYRNGLFRAFEVEGYSMLNEEGVGLHPTDYVIGRFIEKLEDIRDNRVYIIVNNSQAADDIIIKRCYNTVKEYGWLLCKSDNFSGEYPDIHLDPQNIKEVWEWKGFLSSYYPRTSDVYTMVNTLTKEVAELKHQLKLIKQ